MSTMKKATYMESIQKKEAINILKQVKRGDDDITFEHPVDYDTETSPYIQISDPEDDLDAMPNGDEIVTPAVIKVLFNYPLENPVIVTFSDGPFSRRQLAEIICETYAEIYRTEDETTRTQVGLMPGMLNRNQTNGKYGIWGHSIGDLALHAVHPGSIYTLGIDS